MPRIFRGDLSGVQGGDIRWSHLRHRGVGGVWVARECEGPEAEPRQHTSAYVSVCQLRGVWVARECEGLVPRQHTSAYASIRQHTLAYVSFGVCR